MVDLCGEGWSGNGGGGKRGRAKGGMRDREEQTEGKENLLLGDCVASEGVLGCVTLGEVVVEPEIVFAWRSVSATCLAARANSPLSKAGKAGSCLA